MRQGAPWYSENRLTTAFDVAISMIPEP